MSQDGLPRFGRLADVKQRSPVSEAKLYQIAPRYPGLFKKLDGSTIVDFQMLDEILASLPDAQITPPRKREVAS
jgi:hypothetical protein